MKNIKSLIVCLFSIILIGQSLFSAYKIALTGRLFDLYYFLRAGQILTNHGNIYQTGDFNYLALTAPLFIPLNQISVPSAQSIYLTLSISALVISIYLIFRIVNCQAFSWRWWLVLALVFVSFPVKFTLGMGQVNAFLLLTITTGLLLLSKKPVLSGVLFGLATLLKITPGLLLIPLLINRRIKTVGAMVLTFIVGVFISFLLVGREGMIQFVNQLLFNTGLTGKDVYYNQAWSGFLTRLWPSAPVSIWLIGVVLVLAVTLLMSSRNKKNHLVIYCLWIVTLLITSPYTWQHHLILTALPLIILADHVKTKRDWITLILAYLLISFNFRHPEWQNNNIFGKILLSHGFIGCVLLWLWLVKLSITQSREIS